MKCLPHEYEDEAEIYRVEKPAFAVIFKWLWLVLIGLLLLDTVTLITNWL